MELDRPADGLTGQAQSAAPDPASPVPPQQRRGARICRGWQKLIVFWVASCSAAIDQFGSALFNRARTTASKEAYCAAPKNPRTWLPTLAKSSCSRIRQVGPLVRDQPAARRTTSSDSTCPSVLERLLGGDPAATLRQVDPLGMIYTTHLPTGASVRFVRDADLATSPHERPVSHMRRKISRAALFLGEAMGERHRNFAFKALN